MQDEQDEVIAFLSRADSYDFGPGTVERLSTHISHVFLAGAFAFKLKRAVHYTYLDFSTREARRAACEAELALNRRTAPGLYLGVRAIGRTPGGALAFGAEPAEDWVVVMRRFDQALLFDRLAEAGRLDEALMRRLADRIVAFHDQAAVEPGFGGCGSLRTVIADNHACFGEVALDRGRIDALHRHSGEALARVGAILDRRRAEGKVRRCHGDLHLRNICLHEGEPLLFDCIEFSDRLACIDVLYDLAFLLMDLLHRGMDGFANLVLNRYLDARDETDGLACLPLFLSLRAAIRAHVGAFAARGMAEAEARPRLAEAGAYLDLALRLLEEGRPVLLAVGGLSGSGKSTVAAGLAPELGRKPGARVLRSDLLRKRLCGVAPEQRLPEEAYAPAVSRRVYDELGRRAGALLAAGCSVVADAVFAREEERAAIAAIAAGAGATFAGLWLDAPAGVMEARIRGRSGDISDATPEVLRRQMGYDLGRLDWSRIDAGSGRAETGALARAALSTTLQKG